MEVDLEVSKSVGNVNIISERAMLINKPRTSLLLDQVSIVLAAYTSGDVTSL